jgi:hypothetical protein
VLLSVILNSHNSQRSRQTAITSIALLGQQLDVHVGVWLAPVLQGMSPPLMARKIIPVRVRDVGTSARLLMRVSGQHLSKLPACVTATCPFVSCAVCGNFGKRCSELDISAACSAACQLPLSALRQA